MAQIQSINNNIVRGLVITNPQGLVDLDQIESGIEMYNDIQDLKNKVNKLDPSKIRFKSEYIMEQDLDPSFTYKVNRVIDSAGIFIDGIEYEGRVYTVEEVLLMVLEGEKYYSTVTHI